MEPRDYRDELVEFFDGSPLNLDDGHIDAARSDPELCKRLLETAISERQWSGTVSKRLGIAQATVAGVRTVLGMGHPIVAGNGRSVSVFDVALPPSPSKSNSPE